MFLIVPYHVDVPMRCRPWMNWVLIGVTVLFYPLCGSARNFTPLGESLVLGKGSLGWVGHVLYPARRQLIFSSAWWLGLLWVG